MADLLIEKHGSTTVFTINRPDSMNALSPAMMSDLTAGIVEFNADPDQYVAIITGAGEKAFSAGADLKAMAENASAGTQLPISPRPDIAGIAASEKPVIAAVNGLAVAGGLETLLCCDIRISVPGAWFGVFEAKRGILAGIAVSVLPRLLPYGVAADLLLAGERITADRAYQLGLIQQIAEPGDLMDAALKKAAMIASNSQPAVWGSKQVLKFSRDLQLAESQKYYEAVIHRVLLSGDVLEGPRAFAEKREPKFGNRWPSLPSA